MNSGIYQIKCLTTGYVYIGSAADLIRRQIHHWRMLSEGTNHNRTLQFAWNVFGADKFTFEILEHCSEEFLSGRELERIKGHDGPLFNLVRRHTRRPGKLSEAERIKQSERTKKQHENKNFGAHTWRAGTKEKVGKATGDRRRGVVSTPATIEKLKETLAARPWTPERRAAQAAHMNKLRESGIAMHSKWTPERRAAQAERAKKQGLGKS